MRKRRSLKQAALVGHLVEFLASRIAEEIAIADAASADVSWQLPVMPGETAGVAQEAHMMYWSPDRVRRQAMARLEQVNRYVELDDLVAQNVAGLRSPEGLALMHTSMEAFLQLLILASAYSDHPDYQQSWSSPRAMAEALDIK